MPTTDKTSGILEMSIEGKVLKNIYLKTLQKSVLESDHGRHLIWGKKY